MLPFVLSDTPQLPRASAPARTPGAPAAEAFLAVLDSLRASARPADLAPPEAETAVEAQAGVDGETPDRGTDDTAASPDGAPPEVAPPEMPQRGGEQPEPTDILPAVPGTPAPPPPVTGESPPRAPAPAATAPRAEITAMVKASPPERPVKDRAPRTPPAPEALIQGRIALSPKTAPPPQKPALPASIPAVEASREAVAQGDVAAPEPAQMGATAAEGSAALPQNSTQNQPVDPPVQAPRSAPKPTGDAPLTIAPAPVPPDARDAPSAPVGQGTDAPPRPPQPQAVTPIETESRTRPAPSPPEAPALAAPPHRPADIPHAPVQQRPTAPLSVVPQAASVPSAPKHERPAASVTPVPAQPPAPLPVGNIADPATRLHVTVVSPARTDLIAAAFGLRLTNTANPAPPPEAQLPPALPPVVSPKVQRSAEPAPAPTAGEPRAAAFVRAVPQAHPAHPIVIAEASQPLPVTAEQPKTRTALPDRPQTTQPVARFDAQPVTAAVSTVPAPKRAEPALPKPSALPDIAAVQPAPAGAPMAPAPVEPPAPRRTRDPLPIVTADAAPTERALPPDPAQRPDAGVRSEAPLPEARHQPASTETPRQIAEQIAPRLAQAGRAGFDIALHPEELGSVRLKLVSHDGGSMLIIQAERPETLDLMRRHIGALEHELRALGHDQLSLRFNSTSPPSQGTSSGWLTGGQAGAQGGTYSGGQPGSQSGNTPSHAPQPDPPPVTPDPIAARSLVRDHLDLRL